MQWEIERLLLRNVGQFFLRIWLHLLCGFITTQTIGTCFYGKIKTILWLMSFQYIVVQNSSHHGMLLFRRSATTQNTQFKLVVSAASCSACYSPLLIIHTIPKILGIPKFTRFPKLVDRALYIKSHSKIQPPKIQADGLLCSVNCRIERMSRTRHKR